MASMRKIFVAHKVAKSCTEQASSVFTDWGSRLNASAARLAIARRASFCCWIAVLFAFATGASAQLIHTIAGGGPNNVPGILASVQPLGVALDASGNVYLTSRSAVFKLDTGGVLTRLAGSSDSFGYSGDGGVATNARLSEDPYGVAVDAAGNLYIADTNNGRIRAVNTQASAVTLLGITIAPGSIATVAGNGLCCEYSGDGVAATSVRLSNPFGVAVDAAGNLYIADTNNQRIRKVDAGGTITTVAGTGAAGYDGDGGPASSAELFNPFGLAVDAAGNIYIADQSNQRIRAVNTQASAVTLLGITIAPGSIATVAGNGLCCGYSGDGGSATSARLSNPFGVAVDAAGNLYIADQSNHRIRRVDADGTMTTVAGSGALGYNGDGGAASSAQLNYPAGVAVDADGNLYIGDKNNLRIRAVNTQTSAVTVSGIMIAPGSIATVAGNGGCCYSGDGGTATNAELDGPDGVAVDAAGNLYIADPGNERIRVLNTQASAITVLGITIAPGSIATVAGNGVCCGYSGDGGPARNARLQLPTGVAVDAAGNLYIADRYNQRIRMVDTSGTISTVAGTGAAGYNGDGRAATSARLNDPVDVAVDAAGNLYIAEYGNRRIRVVNNQASDITVLGTTIAPGSIATVAGNGIAGYTGDGGLATSAQLNSPYGLAVDVAGNLYIADTNNQRIRRVDTAGIINTVAGSGTAGYDGDGGAASIAQLYDPYKVAVDAAGNLYIADGRNQRIRTVNTQASAVTILGITIAPGSIATVAGNGLAGYTGDGGVATSARLDPSGVVIDAAGNLYIADQSNQRIRKVESAKSTAIIAWNSPTDIVFGTALSATQLNASTDISGTFVYSPPAGTLLGVGTHTLSVVFVPENTALYENSSATVILHVLPAVTGTTLISSLNPAAHGTPITFSATVSSDAGTPTGTVSFYDGAITLGTGNLNPSAQATFTASEFTTGPHMITAVYGGDTQFAGSTSAALTQTVEQESQAAMSLSPSSLTFSNQGVNTTSSMRSSVLANAGGMALTISSIVVSGDFEFAATASSCPHSGGSVSPGTTCTVDVTFTPSQVGSRIGSVTIVTNAANNPQTLTLFGMGVTSVASAAGLQSWWPGESSVTDIRGPNSGTTVGGVTFIPGEVGQAFRFDGSPSSYFTVPNTATFAPTTNQVTIAVWVRPNYLVSNVVDTILSKRDGCGFNRSYILAVTKADAVGLGYPLGSIVWSASVAGDDAISTNTVPDDGFFHFVAGTYDGSNMNVYLDGVLVGVKPHTGPIPITSELPYIGKQGECGDLAYADLDELQFYDRALSQPEISAIYNAATAGVSQDAPAPQIDQPLLPASIAPGGGGLTLTVNGTGFVPRTTVDWNGSPRVTTFVNGSQLTATIAASDIAVAGTASITVSTPIPGGGTSSPVFLPLTSPTGSVSLRRFDLTTGMAPFSVAVGDFTGTGKLSLVTANYAENNVTILRGNGDGSFQSGVSYATGSLPVTVTPGDFNGDGNLDLAVVNNGQGTVSVLLGHGDATFAAKADFSVGSAPFSVKTADLNGDSNLDLIVPNNGSATVSVLLGNGNGTFAPKVDYDAGNHPQYVVIGDFNRDRALDVAVADNSGFVSILLGNGDGSLRSKVDYAVQSPRSIAAADFNNDGNLDLAVAAYDSSLVSVLLGNGDGTFGPAIAYAAGGPTHSVVAGDFDGDGQLDLAAADYDTSQISILRGNGDGTFSQHLDYATPSPVETLAIGDFNNDGRLEIAGAIFSSSTVSVFLQSAVAGLSEATLAFGPQNIGTSSTTKSTTLTNTGSATLKGVTFGVVGTNSGEFGQTNTCATSLAPGDSCTSDVTFTPAAAGARSGTLQISDDAGTPQTVSLSGIGTVPTQPPAITSATSTTFTLGQPGAFTVTATGTPSPSISQSGALPGGLTFNAATHVLSGTPTVAGTFNITFTATNGAGANAVQSFSLTVRLPSVSSLTLSPSSIQGGIANSIGTITLDVPAAGTTTQRRVTLTSSNTTAATVPAAVTIATGATTATFTVTSLAVATSTTSNISAALNGGTQSAVLSVLTAPAVASITLNPASVVGGSANSTGTVALTSPAAGTAAQRRVTLTSSNTAAATAPANVTLATGASTATFTVTSHAVTAVANAVITGTLNGSTTAVLIVNPLALASLTLNPGSVLGGIANSVGTVTLATPAAGTTAQRTVTLSSDNLVAATVPASVTIPTGATSANFTVTSHTVAVSSTANISATLNGVVRSSALTVLPPPSVASLTLSPASVTGGSSNSTATLTLTAPAAGSAAQRRVTLSSSNTAVATVPANITMAAGATTATFVVTSKVVTAASSAIIAATLNSAAGATLAVIPLQITSISLNPSNVTGGNNATGTVAVNAAASGTTAQRTIRLSSSNTSGATVPATVTIASGATSVTFTINTRQVTANATISATLNGATKSAVLTISP